MKKLTKFGILSAVVLLLSGCFAIQRGDEFEHIAPGAWRGLFVFGTDSLAEKVPVNFIVNNSKDNKGFSIEFINGNSKLKADSLKTIGDTLYAWFDNKKKYLRLLCEPNIIEGYWYDSEKKEFPIEFYAQYGQRHRFIDLRLKPKFDINGVWAMDILDESEEIIPAKLTLTVDKNKVYSTLKRATDSTEIFLEGTIQNEKLLLSSFTGDKIYLLKADLRDSITLGRGSFRINDKELACSAKKVK